MSLDVLNIKDLKVNHNLILPNYNFLYLKTSFPSSHRHSIIITSPHPTFYMGKKPLSHLTRTTEVKESGTSSYLKGLGHSRNSSFTHCSICLQTCKRNKNQWLGHFKLIWNTSALDIHDTIYSLKHAGLGLCTKNIFVFGLKS